MTTIENIRDPRFMSADGSVVDVTVDLPGVAPKGIAYTVLKGTAPFDEIVAGNYGSVAPFVPPLVDYAFAINAVAQDRIEGPYNPKRQSVNNYLAQLAAYKALGTISADQMNDLNGLISGSVWEQAMLDKRDELLKAADPAAALAAARDPMTWPNFPADAAAVVATC